MVDRRDRCPELTVDRTGEAVEVRLVVSRHASGEGGPEDSSPDLSDKAGSVIQHAPVTEQAESAPRLPSWRECAHSARARLTGRVLLLATAVR